MLSTIYVKIYIFNLHEFLKVKSVDIQANISYHII